MGNNGELVKLNDDTFWIVQNSFEYMYSYNANVIVCPQRNIFEINGKKIQVEKLTGTILESTIVSDFDGLEYGNLYKLANGQIWEQTEPYIWVWIWVYPEVVIYQKGDVYKMKVQNIDHHVFIERIK